MFLCVGKEVDIWDSVRALTDCADISSVAKLLQVHA